ncbi:MAG: hypothetical protein HC912_06615 [Saprospiraceae bacterium]|nr:hypothetical protein [Saprospiraceae bacterium]
MSQQEAVKRASKEMSGKLMNNKTDHPFWTVWTARTVWTVWTGCANAAPHAKARKKPLRKAKSKFQGFETEKASINGRCFFLNKNG